MQKCGESLVKKEEIQKEQSNKIKDASKIEPKKRRSKLQIILGAIAFIVILSLLVYESSQKSSASSVNIYGIDYHYYDPDTGANWTYFMPGNYTMAAGSTINGSYPFTSDLNCSMTFTKVYSLTPGFVYQIHDLPLTFFPATPMNFNITIMAPPNSFSGQLDVKIYVNYTC